MYQPSFIWIYIIPIMLMSPFISISMNSWFSIWLSLEINFMTFIPLMIFLNKKFMEVSIKYFIIQAFSSSILIMSSNYYLIDPMNTNKMMLFDIMNIIMNMSLFIKMGAAPFHTWFINMMNNLNWLSCLILSTWQKIIPLIIIMYTYNFMMTIIIIIVSCLVSSIFGLNHQSMRMIMSYSSINHLSWMLMNMMINENLFILYFSSYTIINYSIMMNCHLFNIFYINQIMNLKTKKMNNMFFIMNLISISGLPPMFGFMMKWYSVYMMNYSNSIFMLILMMIMSLLTFTFYMRICIIMIMNNNFKNKIKLIYKFHKFNNIKMNNVIMINLFINTWLMSMWLI